MASHDQQADAAEGPAVIAGDLMEMECGLFEPAVAVAADPQH